MNDFRKISTEHFQRIVLDILKYQPNFDPHMADQIKLDTLKLASFLDDDASLAPLKNGGHINPFFWQMLGYFYPSIENFILTMFEEDWLQLGITPPRGMNQKEMNVQIISDICRTESTITPRGAE